MLPSATLREVYAALLRIPAPTDSDLLEATGLPPHDLALAIERLQELRILSSDPVTGTYMAHSPNVALAAVVGPQEKLLHELQNSIGVLRTEISTLSSTYRDVALSVDAKTGFENISDPSRVPDLLMQAIRNSTSSIRMCQPYTDLPEEQIGPSIEIDKQLLGRGVSRQTLFSTRALEDKASNELVRATVPLGAEFRTIDFLPTLFMVFDERMAVIQRNDSSDDTGAILLTDPSLVGIFSGFFDFLWEEATSFLSPGESPNPLTPTQRSILSAMAAGLSDASIARRLGISVRTCRRHIAAMLAALGAESRFQAGVRAVEAGWI